MPAYFVWFRERDEDTIVAVTNNRLAKGKSLTIMRGVLASDEHAIIRNANRLSARGKAVIIVKIQMMIGRQEEVFGDELLELP
jgi:hypothetical protein